MKNGVNMSGMSEIRFEVMQNIEEGHVRFSARANPEHGRSDVAIRTVRVGSQRAACDFSVSSAPYGSDLNQYLPSPGELLLLSLGGCASIAAINGCTVKGITVVNYSMELTATIPEEAGQPLGDIRYVVTLETPAEDGMIERVSKNATCFSPNHRTFLEENSAELKVHKGRPSGESRSRRTPREATGSGGGTSAGGEGRTVKVRLDWQIGTLFTVKIPLRGVEWTMELDQPKQMLGIDRAPNAQEYMLAGMSSEILLAAARLEPDLAINAVDIGSSATMRGFMNTGQGAPVKMHDYVYDVYTDAEGDDVQARLQKVMESCMTYQTVVNPQSVNVVFVHNGNTVSDHVSDMATINEWLAGLQRPMF